MSQLVRLLIAIFLLALSCACLIYAPAISSSENSVFAIAFMVLIFFGFLALLAAILGILFSFSASLYDFWIQVTVFVISNVWLVLVALLHAWVVFLFRFDTLLGWIGILLDVIVIVLVVVSAPKQRQF